MTVLKRFSSIILMGLAVIFSGVCLVLVSQDVYNKQDRVHDMRQQALSTEWEIRSLNAELAFLSRPDRLEHITNAMSHSIAPINNGHNIAVIAPASFVPYYEKEDNSILLIPHRKPAISATTVSVASSPQQPPRQNFNTLLEKIGGVAP